MAEEDAWINTLLGTASKEHIRSPRVEEIISAAAEHLDLMEFLRFSKQAAYQIPSAQAEKLLQKQMNELPDPVFEKLQPLLEDGKLELRQLIGLFVWQRN